MQDRQESQDNGLLNEQVMDSLGVDPENVESSEDYKSESSERENDLPKYAKEKLGMQEKRHKKEMRMLKSQLEELRNQVSSQSAPMMQQENQYMSQPNNQSSDPMQQAVAAAMQAIEQKQRQQKEMERMQHVQKQYQDLQSDLDNASDKYEDFDDVVRNPNAGFTEAMRDAALIIPKSHRADVLYKLGKNPDERDRISKLQPIEQAQEMMKLAFALMGGNGVQPQASTAVKTMGNIKSNPVSNSSASVSDKTPISDLRRRIKAGWK